MNKTDFLWSVAAGVLVFGLVKVYEYYFEGGKEAKEIRRAQVAPAEQAAEPGR